MDIEFFSFVPTLDIAAGAFFPQKKAVPICLDMSHVQIEESVFLCVFYVFYVGLGSFGVQILTRRWHRAIYTVAAGILVNTRGHVEPPRGRTTGGGEDHTTIPHA